MICKKHCNIFCAITPFHYFIIKEFFQEEYSHADKNILITNFDLDKKDKMIKSGKCIHFSMHGKDGWEAYLKKTYREKLNTLIDQIKEETKEYESINLYSAILINSISNGIYTILKNKQYFKYINFPDGIASFTTTNRTYIDYVKLYTKIFLSKIGLFRYSSFGGTGDSQGIYCADVIYTFLPELIKDKTNAIIKRLELVDSFSINNNDDNNNRILFLGQPGNEELTEEALNYIKTSYKSGSIYYKKHHRENDHTFKEFCDKYDLKIVDTNKCIEEYFFTEKNFKTVISINSSALINLKMIYKNKVECISFKGFKAIESFRKKELIELYKKFNVKLIK